MPLLLTTVNHYHYVQLNAIAVCVLYFALQPEMPRLSFIMFHVSIIKGIKTIADYKET